MMNTKVRAIDLSGRDLGRVVTISYGRTAVTGMLTRVDHVADLVAVPNFAQENPDLIPGRRHLSVTVGGVDWNGIDPDAGVIVEVDL